MAADRPTDVVLCNFGGPTREAEVEPFLRRLFEDPFILRSHWLGPRSRAFIAKRISRKRAPKILPEYQSIGFSPINRMTEIQARHLEKELTPLNADTRVIVVNRYTAPFADDVVATLQPRDRRLFLITLYPHTCHSTVVSSYRDFDLALERRYGARDIGATKIYSWWYNRRFIEHGAKRLTAAIEPALAGKEHVTVLFSAHGIPEKFNERGDPYVNETMGHYNELRRLAEAWLAGRGAQGRVSFHLSFQSRVGPVAWVKPYTEEVITSLGRGPGKGGSLVMVPISFTADHIETLSEMDHTYKALALAQGFTAYFRAAPANDDPELAACLREVLVQHGF